MQHGTKNHTGYHFIAKAIKKLKKQDYHTENYGKYNNMRMSGK